MEIVTICPQYLECADRFENAHMTASGDTEAQRLAAVAVQMSQSERSCGALCQPFLNSLTDLLTKRKEERR